MKDVNNLNEAVPAMIRVEIELGQSGLYYAESPDLRGLLVAKPTLNELTADIPRAIQEIFELKGKRVSITRGNDKDAFQCWLATPV